MFRRFFATTSPFSPSPAWRLFSYTVLVFWAIVVLFPLYWLVITSFKLPIDVSQGPKYLPFVDFQPSLHAWEYILFDQGVTVTRPYTNTIIVGFWGALVSLIVGSLASYGLTRFTYRPKPALVGVFLALAVGALAAVIAGVPPLVAVAVAIALFFLLAQTIGRRFKGTLTNNDIAFWLISQRMLPPVAVVIPIYLVYQQLGLLNTHAALIITYTTINLPLVIWFMRDYFASIPFELEESAFIDGASRYQVFYRIILPLSTPGLIATFLIALVFSWNEYILALFLTGADTQTMPMLVVAQNATRGPQWWNISVLVVLMIAPITIMALFLERFIAKGILVGAVKG